MSRDPFDFWNRNGHLEYSQENVRIYRVDGEQYLFVGQTMYASTTERKWYIRNVYPHAKGRCLEIGLGLGVASKVILASSRVSHLLTIEKNVEVITAFGRPLLRHNILQADVYEWVENVCKFEAIYDLIFVDHYTFEDEELGELEGLATNLRPLLKDGGKMIFWIDENAPEGDQEAIRALWS